MNNQVVQGEIVSAHFGYVKRNEEESGSGELQEDKPEVNIIKQAQISYHWNPDIEIDFAITIYDVMITSYIPERGTIIKDLNKTDIFSSLEILFQVLNVKYYHSLKLIKAK